MEARVTAGRRHRMPRLGLFDVDGRSADGCVTDCAAVGGDARRRPIDRRVFCRRATRLGGWRPGRDLAHRRRRPTLDAPRIGRRWPAVVGLLSQRANRLGGRRSDRAVFADVGRYRAAHAAMAARPGCRIANCCCQPCSGCGFSTLVAVGRLGRPRHTFPLAFSGRTMAAVAGPGCRRARVADG